MEIVKAQVHWKNKWECSLIKDFSPLSHTTAVYSLKLSINHRRAAAVTAAGSAESGGGVFMTAAKKSLL